MSGPEITELEAYATTWESQGVEVHRAHVTLGEQLDGDPVTRLTLLMNDPSDETWDVDAVREMRYALGRRATELGLPRVTLTLVPESEAELFDTAA